MPKISARSSKEELHKWLEAQFDGWDRQHEGGYTLNQLWAEVRSVIEASSPGTVKEARAALHLPGWGVGWNDEISASAAVRDLRSKNGRRRIVVMTQDDHEPRDPNASVELGLYELADDEWVQVHYADFDTPADAVKAVQTDPTWA